MSDNVVHTFGLAEEIDADGDLYLHQSRCAAPGEPPRNRAMRCRHGFIDGGAQLCHVCSRPARESNPVAIQEPVAETKRWANSAKQDDALLLIRASLADGGWHTVGEIQLAAGMTRGRVRKRLVRLARAGHLEQTKSRPVSFRLRQQEAS